MEVASTSKNNSAKRRKNSGKTPSITPPELQVVQDQDTSVDALQAFLEAFGEPDGMEVRVAEKVGGSRQLMQRYALNDFDPWKFAEEYGGGNYIALVHNAAGQYVGAKAFAVSPVIKGTLRATPASATPPASPAPNDKMLDVLVAMIGQQAQSQTAILTALIGRQPQQTGPSWDAVLGLLKDKQQTPLGEMFDVLERARGFVEVNGSDKADGPDLLAALTGLLGTLGGAGTSAKVAEAPKRRLILKRTTPPANTPPASADAGGAQSGAVDPAHGSSVTSPAASPPAPLKLAGTDSAASAAGADDDDETVAPPELVARSLCEIVTGRTLMTGGNYDPREFAAELADTFDDASLSDFLAGVQPGELFGAMIEHVPDALRGAVASEEAERQIGELEKALRELLDLDGSSGGGGDDESGAEGGGDAQG